MSDNPLDKLATLGRLLKERAAELGLDMQTFLPVPDLSGNGVHIVQGVFVVEMPEALANAVDADDDVAAALAGIMQATKDQELANFKAEQERAQQERADAARERMLRLREKLENGEGLLD